MKGRRNKKMRKGELWKLGRGKKWMENKKEVNKRGEKKKREKNKM